MEDFQIDYIDDILVVKVDLIAATLRDAQPLWIEFENHMLFKHSKIIIDLSTCAHIDSTFIGMIVKIFRKVRENKGQMMLVFPKVSTIEVFRLMGLTQVVDCFNNLEEAIEQLRLKFPLQEHSLFEEKFFQN
jgi:anti-anti-sigma factor